MLSPGGLGSYLDHVIRDGGFYLLHMALSYVIKFNFCHGPP